MVKHENFKTCDQSGFCKRNRALANEATSKGAKWASPYRLDAKSLAIKDGQVTGTILKTLEGSAEEVRYPLVVSFLKAGSVRVTVDEEKRQKGAIEFRHDSKARKERYNEASKWAIVGGLELDKSAKGTIEKESTVVKFGPGGSYQAVIHHSPFGVDFLKDGHAHIKLNNHGLMNMEHWRAKVEKPKEEPKEEPKEAEVTEVAVDESTWWEESFGGNTDSKPKGPESVGLDITFPGYDHVFGIPSHASPLSLKETR